MIDFSINTNSLGLSKSLIRTLTKHVYGSICEYPDYTNKETLSILGKFFGVSSKNIGLGVGSTQIFFDIPNLLKYKRAVIIVPTFWEYATFNKLFDKKIKKIHLLERNNFKPDYSLIQKTIKNGDCVFICNVNNPTSTLYKKKELLELIKNNPNIQFVIDETYLVFRNDYAKQSLVKQVQEQKNLCVVTSLSKFFSIPGVRLGVLISHKGIIDTYNKRFHIPYSITPISLVVLKNLLTDKDFIVRSQLFYDLERERIYKLLKKALSDRLLCFESDGNFIMARILTKQKSLDVINSLKKRGILVRGGHELSDITDKWLRFSIRSTNENKDLVKELDKVLRR